MAHEGSSDAASAGEAAGGEADPRPGRRFSPRGHQATQPLLAERASGRRFRSISEEVAETLRDMILVGELKPEAQITQEDLAARLGVSTMPVREALLRLSHEGFIEARRGRSFRVTRTTRRDVADMYWLHATIEGELTRRACAAADDIIPSLESCTDAWREAVEEGRTQVLERLNFDFHRIINQAADSPALIRQFRHTLRSIPQHFYSLIPEWVDLSTAGHDRIVEAIRHKDADGAAEAAAEHVLEAGAALSAYFDDTGFWTPPGGGA